MSPFWKSFFRAMWWEKGEAQRQRQRSEPMLQMEQRAAGFALVRIDEENFREELALSEQDLLVLPQLLQDMTQRLIRAHTTSGMDAAGIVPIPAVSVVNVKANADVFKSEILLTLSDQFGNDSGFALPFDIVKPLSAYLSAKVEELEAAQRQKSLS